MKFCIATVAYWSSKGYDTSNWRKNVDGTKAVCHLEYAEILSKNLDDNPNVQIYDLIDPQFKLMMGSEEWMEEGEEAVIEDTSMACRICKLEEEVTNTQLAVAELIEAQLGGEL